MKINPIYCNFQNYNKKTSKHNYSTNFKGIENPIFKEYAQIVIKGNLEEVKNIAWKQTRDTNARTLLHEAVQKAKIEVINYLSDVISPNIKDANGISSFNLACKNNRFDLVKLFLSKNADINTSDSIGNTPLINTVDNMEIFKHLLEHNANPNLQNSFGLAPIHLAYRELNFVKLLKKHGANINIKDENGTTITHYAAEEGRTDLLEKYIELGIDVNVLDIDDKSPAFYAKDLKTLQYLYLKGADLNILDKSEQTLLHSTLKHNNIEIANFLMENFPEMINTKDENGKTPIFFVKTLEAFDSLIKKKADYCIQDNDGNTLLHQFTLYKNIDLIKRLLDLGLNENITNNYGMSAKDIALESYNLPNKILFLQKNNGFNKVIGMTELKKLLYDTVINPLKNPEKYEKYGLTPSNGILLHGLPGCGKTFIAEALAEETGRNLYRITTADISSPYAGDASVKIKQIFNQARNNPPSIVFIDEMEGIAPERGNLNDSTSAAVSQDMKERVTELLQQMNNLSKDNIFVIGATNHPEMVDAAVKRTGRLDKKIFVSPPDYQARKGMFLKELENRPVERDIRINILAKQTENYTAKEINEVVNFAARIAMNYDRKITMQDLLNGIKQVKPAISKADIQKYKKEVSLSEAPNLKKSFDNNKPKGFAKVAGMNTLKRILQQDIIEPLQRVEEYKKYNLSPANGILLYGPPGTGKTFIAEALAEETGRHFISMSPSSVLSPYHNQTALNIKKVFDEAEYNSPSIVFIDEIEALAPKRNSIGGSGASDDIGKQITELLQQFNNASEKDIFIIAATNEPQLIDDAIKRVGRFDKTVFVPPPDIDAREELFEIYLKNSFINNDINYKELAQKTENYTAAEIKNVIVNQAALKALESNEPISQKYLIKEINVSKPILSNEKIEFYKNKLD